MILRKKDNYLHFSLVKKKIRKPYKLMHLPNNYLFCRNLIWPSVLSHFFQLFCKLQLHSIRFPYQSKTWHLSGYAITITPIIFYWTIIWWIEREWCLVHLLRASILNANFSWIQIVANPGEIQLQQRPRLSLFRSWKVCKHTYLSPQSEKSHQVKLSAGKFVQIEMCPKRWRLF